MRAAGAKVGVDGNPPRPTARWRAVDPADRQAAYFALRATLCSRRDDFVAFDAAFAELFAPPAVEAPALPEELEPASLVLPRMAVPAEEVAVPADAEADVVPSAWSDAELLREKDFADYTDAERAGGPPRDAQARRRRAQRPQPPHAPLTPPRRAAARRPPRPAPHDPLVASHGRGSRRAPLARALGAATAARARV